MGEGTVVVRLSSLGDVVLVGSITGGLEEPVTLVTAPHLAEVGARLPGVTRVVAPDAARGLPGRWIDLQRSLVTVRLAPRARRVRKHSLRRRLAARGWAAPRPDVPTLYARAAGVPVQPRPWLDVARTAADMLVLVPGAAWTPKQAPPELLVAAGRAWPGPVVVLGSADEAALVQEVAGRVPGAGALAERGFAGTLELARRARVVLGGDTGLVHLLGAAGARVIALFGPTWPGDGFAVHPGEVVERQLPCRPCALHRVQRCRRGDTACLALDAARVREAVLRCAG